MSRNVCFRYHICCRPSSTSAVSILLWKVYLSYLNFPCISTPHTPFTQHFVPDFFLVDSDPAFNQDKQKYLNTCHMVQILSLHISEVVEIIQIYASWIWLLLVYYSSKETPHFKTKDDLSRSEYIAAEWNFKCWNSIWLIWISSVLSYLRLLFCCYGS